MLKLPAKFVAVGVLGVGMATFGSAAAQAVTKPVVSDNIKFSGTATPGATQGTYTFKSSSCSLQSDGETKSFPCKMTGTATIGSPITGTAKATSADGKQVWKYTLTPTGANTYDMKGAGKETDPPENGKPATTNKATMAGAWTVTPNPDGSLAVAGNVVVSEASTAP